MLSHLEKLNCNLVIETNVRVVKDWGGGFFTVQYGTVQYNTVTVQCNTVQKRSRKYKEKEQEEIGVIGVAWKVKPV